MRRSVKFWMALALPVLILVVGGLYYDTRLFFVAAVVIFILFPTLLFIGWQTILTRPWAVASMFPQIVTLGSDDSLTVEYYPLNDESDRHPADFIIERDKISDCQVWGDNYVVSYDDGKDLIVPINSFENQADASSFLNRLSPAE